MLHGAELRDCIRDVLLRHLRDTEIRRAIIAASNNSDHAEIEAALRDPQLRAELEAAVRSFALEQAPPLTRLVFDNAAAEVTPLRIVTERTTFGAFLSSSAAPSETGPRIFSALERGLRESIPSLLSALAEQDPRTSAAPAAPAAGESSDEDYPHTPE